MKTIVLIDTSMLSNNIGDEIIIDSVNEFINKFFTGYYIHKIPSHEPLSENSKFKIKNSDFCFIGGTNILSPSVNINNLWKIAPEDIGIFSQTETISIGVGWNDYTKLPNEVGKEQIKSIFSKKYVSSTRDSYTKKHLTECGVSSIVTSCPTTWMLSKEFCTQISKNKSKSVVFTLTAWRADYEKDKQIVNSLKKHYENLYFFPQMMEDLDYLKSISNENINVITPSLFAFDHFLENEHVDFVGTRLHGGIRALQKKKRALIISVDNRAKEIARDINLPTVDRHEFTNHIEKWCEDYFLPDISVPYVNISSFISQLPTLVNPNGYKDISLF